MRDRQNAGLHIPTKSGVWVPWWHVGYVNLDVARPGTSPRSLGRLELCANKKSEGVGLEKMEAALWLPSLSIPVWQPLCLSPRGSQASPLRLLPRGPRLPAAPAMCGGNRSGQSTRRSLRAHRRCSRRTRAKRAVTDQPAIQPKSLTLTKNEADADRRDRKNKYQTCSLIDLRSSCVQIHELEPSDVPSCPLSGVRFYRDANIFVNNFQLLRQLVTRCPVVRIRRGDLPASLHSNSLIVTKFGVETQIPMPMLLLQVIALYQVTLATMLPPFGLRITRLEAIAFIASSLSVIQQIPCVAHATDRIHRACRSVQDRIDERGRLSPRAAVAVGSSLRLSHLTSSTA